MACPLVVSLHNIGTQELRIGHRSSFFQNALLDPSTRSISRDSKVIALFAGCSQKVQLPILFDQLRGPVMGVSTMVCYTIRTDATIKNVVKRLEPHHTWETTAEIDAGAGRICAKYRRHLATGHCFARPVDLLHVKLCQPQG